MLGSSAAHESQLMHLLVDILMRNLSGNLHKQTTALNLKHTLARYLIRCITKKTRPTALKDETVK